MTRILTVGFDPYAMSSFIDRDADVTCVPVNQREQYAFESWLAGLEVCKACFRVVCDKATPYCVAGAVDDFCTLRGVPEILIVAGLHETGASGPLKEKKIFCDVQVKRRSEILTSVFRVALTQMSTGTVIVTESWQGTSRFDRCLTAEVTRQVELAKREYRHLRFCHAVVSALGNQVSHGAVAQRDDSRVMMSRQIRTMLGYGNFGPVAVSTAARA